MSERREIEDQNLDVMLRVKKSDRTRAGLRSSLQVSGFPAFVKRAVACKKKIKKIA